MTCIGLIEFGRTKGAKDKKPRKRRGSEYILPASVGVGAGVGSEALKAGARKWLRNQQAKAGVSYEDVRYNPDKLKNYKRGLDQIPDSPFSNKLKTDLDSLIKSSEEMARLENKFEPMGAKNRRLEELEKSINNREDFDPGQKRKAIDTLRKRQSVGGGIAKYDPKVAREAKGAKKQYTKFKNNYEKKLDSIFPKKMTKGKLAKALVIGGLASGASSVGVAYGMNKLKGYYRKKNNT